MLKIHRLNTSLVLAQIMGVLMLLRSVALDRWITVLATVLMLVGATAARRNRSWGVLLAFAAATAFPVAWLIGIAPSFFVMIGAAGMLPFLLASRAFAKADKGATMLLASVAAAAGASGAMIWKQIAWPVFIEHPMLRPSLYPHHGAWLLPLLALAIVALRVRPGRSGSPGTLVTSEHESEPQAHVRIGDESDVPRARIARDASDPFEREAFRELDAELDHDGRALDEAPALRRADRGST